MFTSIKDKIVSVITNITDVIPGFIKKVITGESAQAASPPQGAAQPSSQAASQSTASNDIASAAAIFLKAAMLFDGSVGKFNTNITSMSRTNLQSVRNPLDQIDFTTRNNPEPQKENNESEKREDESKLSLKLIAEIQKLNESMSRQEKFTEEHSSIFRQLLDVNNDQLSIQNKTFGAVA